MSIRSEFVKEFGEEQAVALENAAEMHGNGINDANRGSDPFKWVLLITIGYECFTEYREEHGITLDVEKLKNWIVNVADLASHDGDCDYISLLGGTYNQYLKGVVN